MDQQTDGIKYSKMRLFECYCSKKFGLYSSLKKHNHLIHGASVTTSVSFLCSRCHDKFDNEADFRTHVMTKHRKMIQALNRKSNVGEVTKKIPCHPCPFCDEVMTQKRWLVRHIRVAHRSVQDQGQQCHPVIEANKNDIVPNLEPITKKKTSPDSKQKCSLCSHVVKSAKSPVEMLRHVTMKHIKEKLFQCWSCAYKSKTSFQIKRHCEKVHEKFERFFACSICFKRYYGSERGFFIHAVVEHFQNQLEASTFLQILGDPEDKNNNMESAGTEKILRMPTTDIDLDSFDKHWMDSIP